MVKKKTRRKIHKKNKKKTRRSKSRRRKSRKKKRGGRELRKKRGALEPDLLDKSEIDTVRTRAQVEDDVDNLVGDDDVDDGYITQNFTDSDDSGDDSD